MHAANVRLTPAQRRAYESVIDLVRRASEHLTFLRIAGVPLEQDEQRITHLLQASEGILAADEAMSNVSGE